MTIYLNMKSSYGTETVDEFTRGENSPENPKEFRRYVSEMVRNYWQSGMPVYTSQRCTKEWKES